MITQTGNYRITITETNILPQVPNVITRKAAFVIESEAGPDFPYLVDSVQKLLNIYGKPTNNILGVLELLPYISAGYSAWIVRAIRPDSKYAGIDITKTGALGFGKRTGRNDISNNTYTSLQRDITFTAAYGDGLTGTFSVSSIPYTNTGDSIVANSLKLYLGNSQVTLNTTDGYTYSNSNGTTVVVNNSTLSMNINFGGTPGQKAELATDSISGAIDLTTINYSSDFTGSTPFAMNLYIDNIVVLNFSIPVSDLSSLTDSAGLVSLLNSKFQAITGTTLSPFSFYTVGTSEYLKISGFIGSSTEGRVKVSSPSNFTLQDLFKKIVVNAPSVTEVNETTPSSDPTGEFPLYNQEIKVDIIYQDNQPNEVSHSFYAFSKYDDSFKQLAGKILYDNIKNRYTLILYERDDTGNFNEISSYTYSLDPNGTDDFGFNIYIKEVFKNNEYVIPLVNENYTGPTSFTSTDIVPFTGGSKGSSITESDIQDAWNKLTNKKYESFLLVDFYGFNNSPAFLSELIEKWHPYGFALTRIPNGLNVNNAILYAKSVSSGKKLDNVALYFNRIKIINPYTLGTVYVTALGDLATRFAEMEPDFDGFSPAFIDRPNGYGGQLRFFSPLEAEYELTESQKEDLDNNLVNPLVLDEIYGLMAYGDRTLDPNTYINERRVSSFLIREIIKNVLEKTIGELNTPFTRKKVELDIFSILNSALASGVISNPAVLCNEENNKDELARGGRKLIVDVFISIPPSIQRIHLRFTRTSSTISVTTQ